MNWIKISERLPSEEEQLENVIAWWNPDFIYNVDIGDLSGSIVYVAGGYVHISHYSHWAIIELPKEEREE